MTPLTPELLDVICALLPRKDLEAVALSDSKLCAVAQRILFREITIGNNTLAAASPLTEKPHLIRCVQTLNVALGETATIASSSYHVVTELISHMSELVSLSISIPESQGSSILPRNVTFPRLQNLKISFDFDAHVLHFLHAAPGVVLLSLRDRGTAHGLGWHSPIPPNILPALASWNGSLAGARALILGRPVSSVLLTTDNLTASDVRILARRSSAELKNFDAKISMPLLPVLQAIADEMPKLENLRLSTSYEFWPGAGRLCAPMLDSVQSILGNLANLKSAEISGIIWAWRAASVDTVLPDILPLSEWLSEPDSAYSGFDTGCSDYHMYSDFL